MSNYPAPITNDHRTRDTAKPHIWLVATDRTMSGWGHAPRNSYVAYPTYGHEDRKVGREWLKRNDAFIRVRENLSLPRLRKGDHLSIYDRGWVDQPRAITAIYDVEVVENRVYHYILVGEGFILQVSWDGFTRLDALPDYARPSDWMEIPTWTQRFIRSAYDLGLLA